MRECVACVYSVKYHCVRLECVCSVCVCMPTGDTRTRQRDTKICQHAVVCVNERDIERREGEGGVGAGDRESAIRDGKSKERGKKTDRTQPTNGLPVFHLLPANVHTHIHTQFLVRAGARALYLPPKKLQVMTKRWNVRFESLKEHLQKFRHASFPSSAHQEKLADWYILQV